MVEGGVTIVKYVLFLCNLILWVIGLALCIGGVVLHLRYQGLMDLLHDTMFTTPVILLSLGGLCTLLGFLGCCGSIRENYCLTVSFAVILALVLMIETATVIATYALHEPVQEKVIEELTKGMRNYRTSAAAQFAWDNTHRKMQCCGVANLTDWQANNDGSIPSSCCYNEHDCTADGPFYPNGCRRQIEDWVQNNGSIVGGVATALAALQVMGVCFACCLSKSILKDFHDFYY